MALNNVLGSYKPNNLFAANQELPAVADVLEIAAGQNLKRGSIVNKDGVLVSATDTNVYAVLAEDCDTTESAKEAPVYLTGEFNIDAVKVNDNVNNMFAVCVSRNGKRTMPEPSNDPFVDLGNPSLKASETYNSIFPNPGFTIGQQSIVFQEVQPSLACTVTEWTIYDNNPTDSLGWGGMVYDGGFENQLCSNSDVTLTELGETSSGSGIYGHKYTHNNGGLQLSANTTYRFVASCQGSSSGSTKIVQYDGTTSKKDLRMAESGYNVSQWVTFAQATQVDGTYLKVKTSDNNEYVI